MPPIIPTGVPFAQIPHALIEDDNVSHSAVRVYCYLMRRADSEGRMYPGQRLIAEDISMSTSTVTSAIASLEELGWLVVERSRSDKGRQAVNRYVIHGQVAEIETSPEADNRNQPVADSETGGVAIIATELDPLLTTSSELVAPNSEVKERPRNLWWDELVEMFGEPTTDNRRKLYGRITALVSDQPVSEIRRRSAWIVENWGHEKLTPTSLETHWSRFDAAIGQVSDADVEAFVAAQARGEMLERLADE